MLALQTKLLFEERILHAVDNLSERKWLFINSHLLIVWEPNAENCLDSIFVASSSEEVISVPDTKSLTSVIRKFMHAKS